MQCYIEGMMVAKTRYKVFDQKFIDANFKTESDKAKKMFGKPLSKGCHPDNGNGYMGRKLKFEDWFRLNCAQRAHGNYLETVATTEVLLLTGGAFFPLPAAGAAAIFMVGRYMYGSGFRNKGPGGRGKGFMLSVLSNLALFGMSVYGAGKLALGSKLITG